MTTKKKFLVIVPNKTRQTVFDTIEKVLLETQTKTDCFSSYRKLSTIKNSKKKLLQPLYS